MTREELDQALEMLYESDFDDLGRNTTPVRYPLDVIGAAARMQLALMAEFVDDPECGDCDHLPRKVYPQETVEKLAETIYNGNLPTPELRQNGADDSVSHFDDSRHVQGHRHRRIGRPRGDGMKPIVYMIGSSALEHGERAELDAEHPDACLCGFEDYMLCPRFDEGIGSWTIHPADGASE